MVERAHRAVEVSASDVPAAATPPAQSSKCGQRFDWLEATLGRQKPKETLAVRLVLLVEVHSKPFGQDTQVRAPDVGSMASLVLRPRSSKKEGWQTQSSAKAWPVPSVVVLKGHWRQEAMCVSLGVGEKVPTWQL
jgi:hypothetical protein